MTAELHTAWTDPTAEVVYILDRTPDSDPQFATLTPDGDGTLLTPHSPAPEPRHALLTAPHPAPGTRYLVLFQEDIAANEPRWYTAISDTHGHWTVDGSERWRYDTDELVVGSPAAAPAPDGIAVFPAHTG